MAIRTGYADLADTIADLEAIPPELRTHRLAVLLVKEAAWYVFDRDNTAVPDRAKVVMPVIGSGRWIRCRNTEELLELSNGLEAHLTNYGRGGHIPPDGFTNAEMAANASISWTKVSKEGASPSQVGAQPANSTLNKIANTSFVEGDLPVYSDLQEEWLRVSLDRIALKPTPNQFEKAQSIAPKILPDLATIVPDGSSSNYFEIDLTVNRGNRVLAPLVNPVPGTAYSFHIHQSLGGQALILSPQYQFPVGIDATTSLQQGSSDIMTCQCASNGKLYCVMVKGWRES